MSIGRNIFILMQNAGISSERLSEEMNYSYRDMCRIFKGELLLPPTEIKKIADFFGITKQELINYK